jgi:hypothetical protein
VPGLEDREPKRTKPAQSNKSPPGRNRTSDPMMPVEQLQSYALPSELLGVMCQIRDFQATYPRRSPHPNLFGCSGDPLRRSSLSGGLIAPSNRGSLTIRGLKPRMRPTQPIARPRRLAYIWRSVSHRHRSCTARETSSSQSDR